MARAARSLGSENRSAPVLAHTHTYTERGARGAQSTCQVRDLPHRIHHTTFCCVRLTRLNINFSVTKNSRSRVFATKFYYMNAFSVTASSSISPHQMYRNYAHHHHQQQKPAGF